jgi:hypothetical protein
MRLLPKFRVFRNKTFLVAVFFQLHAWNLANRVKKPMFQLKTPPRGPKVENNPRNVEGQSVEVHLHIHFLPAGHLN